MPISEEAIEAERLKMELLYGGKYKIIRTPTAIYLIDVTRFITKPSNEPLPYDTETQQLD